MPARTQSWTSWLLTVAALGLAVLGGLQWASADAGTRSERTTVGGLPVTVLVPSPAPAGRLPGAVVVHGYAASGRLMLPLAGALARAGFVTAVVDLSGHGRNARPLAEAGTDDQRDRLQQDLGVAVALLRARSDVDPGRLVLVGHSMGAGAVTRFAVADPPAVRATVALSLPSAGDLPADPAVPRNLLLLVGSAEQPAFLQAALDGLRRGYPAGEWGTTYGSTVEGTARRAEQVAGAEHVSIVWRQQAAEATVRWAAAAVGLPDPDAVVPSTGLLSAAGLLYLAAAVGFVPLARLLLSRASAAEQAARWRPPVAGPGTTLLGALGGAVLAGLAGWAFPQAAQALPVAVGGYLAVWFAVAGATATAVWWVTTGRHGREPPPPGRGLWLAGLALAAYTGVTMAGIGQLTWADFTFVGRRLVALAVLLAAFLVFFVGDEHLVARWSRGRRLVWSLATRLVVVAGLVAAVVLLDAPRFLILLVPLMLVVLLWHAGYAFVVAGRTRSVLLPAVVQAVPLALLVAATVPLTS